MDKWTPPGNEDGQIGPDVSEDNDERWIEPGLDPALIVVFGLSLIHI